MKITKRVFAILFAVAILLSVAMLSASAETTSQPRLIDNADLLTDTEEAEISSLLVEYSEKQNCDIVFLTEPDLKNADFNFNGTAEDYADTYYDTHGYASDGVLVFITLTDETGQRKVQFSCTGKCKKRLSDDEQNEIIDDVFSSLKNSDYYTAIKKMTNEINEKLPVSLKWYMLPLAIVIGFVIAMLIMNAIRSKLKTVAMQHGAKNYVRQGSMNVTASRDTYLYSTVSKTAKPKNDSSSRTSSGGGSHSGVGRNF
ncbi:MAG: TPM domain-containing protein [Ruminococcus sp.]|nr:TPM domain-containing protein [Ruminococcus sp.]